MWEVSAVCKHGRLTNYASAETKCGKLGEILRFVCDLIELPDLIEGIQSSVSVCARRVLSGQCLRSQLLHGFQGKIDDRIDQLTDRPHEVVHF